MVLEAVAEQHFYKHSPHAGMPLVEVVAGPVDSQDFASLIPAHVNPWITQGEDGGLYENAQTYCTLYGDRCGSLQKCRVVVRYM